MISNHGPEKISERVAQACGAIAACMGAVVLVCWAVGRGTMTALGEHYIPMAPNTALLFALLGCVLVVYHGRTASRHIRRGVAAVALFSMILAGATLFDIFSGHALCVDRLFVRITEILGAVPKGHMSAVTACCFLLTGAAVLLLLRQAVAATAILGTIIIVVGWINVAG